MTKHVPQELGPVSVSVVCPFYNESSIIELAIQRMVRNLEQQLRDDWELVLVDDGSVDDSVERLVKWMESQQRRNLRLISYPINQGRGRALKTGIDAAVGDTIVTTELDCSWGDDIVGRLVAELNRHPDVDFVIASPHLPGGGLVNVTAHRRWLTRAGNVLIRSFFDSGVTMNTGMTRAYRSRCIKPLVVHENGKEFHLEVLLKLRTLGFRPTEIPATITWRDAELRRQSAAKRRSSTRIGRTIASHLKFLTIAQPVTYFALVAALSGVTGIVLLAAAVFALFTETPSVFLAILGLMMCLFCLQFLGFAVLFFQIREGMRESWMQYYPGSHPPSARGGRQIHPPVG